MAPSSSSVRILAIDDDDCDLELVRRFVRQIKSMDIELVTCEFGEAGIEALQEGPQFDVLLLDYQLGRQTGTEVLALMRVVDPLLPVIFLTGRGDEQTLGKIIRAGASDCLSKNSLSPSSLERSIRNAAEKGRLTREISQNRNDLEKLVVVLKARESESRNFYHVLSHELKTPLTAIREFISIVVDELAGEVSAKQKEYLGVAKSNCDHLTTILNDILDVTRMETGKLSICLLPVSLNEWVKLAAQPFQSAIAQAELSLYWDLQENLPEVQADKQRLDQVLGNLLTNAVKFTPAGGQITIRTAPHLDDADMIEISVSDTGRGIEPGRVDLVFDRLYQAKDEDFSIQGGLGLGLNICQGIVRSHGGEIWVESTLGAGSCFTFALPRAEVTPLAAS